LLATLMGAHEATTYLLALAKVHRAGNEATTYLLALAKVHHASNGLPASTKPVASR
jgi:hypothetical protein